MSIPVRVFGQRLLHEHDSASIWPEAVNEHDSASVWSKALS